MFGEKNDLQFGYEITEFSFKSSPATKKTRRLNGLTAVFVQSVTRNDFTLIQGMVMLIAAFYVFVNLLVDLLYAVLDPRIRYD